MNDRDAGRAPETVNAASTTKFRNAAVPVISERPYQHPMHLAREIAHLLESDTIAARMVKDYVGTDRLEVLLGFTSSEKSPEIEDSVDGVSSVLEPIDIVNIVGYLRTKYTTSDILKALHHP